MSFGSGEETKELGELKFDGLLFTDFLMKLLGDEADDEVGELFAFSCWGEVESKDNELRRFSDDDGEPFDEFIISEVIFWPSDLDDVDAAAAAANCCAAVVSEK